MEAVSTTPFNSVSTAACMKPSFEVTSKEVWTEARGNIFFHGSYFHGGYFHERLDGSFHESFHELHAETASRLRMLPPNLPFKTSAHLAEMGPDLLFAESSMVAASMDAFVEVVVTVPRPYRHP